MNFSGFSSNQNAAGLLGGDLLVSSPRDKIVSFEVWCHIRFRPHEPTDLGPPKR